MNNIYTFSKYSGINPENVNNLGYDTSGGYPNRSYCDIWCLNGFLDERLNIEEYEKYSFNNDFDSILPVCRL